MTEERCASNMNPLRMNNTESKVACVIVTYFPDYAFINKVLLSIKDQVDEVIIINNSNHFLFDIGTIFTEDIYLIELGDNYGIAYAHNVGLIKAKSLGYKFALLLDQDSLPSPMFVKELMKAFDINKPDSENIVASGPSYVDIRNNTLIQHSSVGKFNNNFLYVNFLISSGLLISIDKIYKIGGMDSSYFIDLVDYEWCYRAALNGYKLIGSNSARMEHNIGKRLIIIDKIFNITYHDPLRNYYLTRNTISLLKKYKFILNYNSIIFHLITIIKIILKAPLIYFLIDKDFNRFKFIYIGLIHGFNNISGKLDFKSFSCIKIKKTELE